MKRLTKYLKIWICLVVGLSGIGIYASFPVQAVDSVAADPPAPINQVFPDGALAQVIATKLGKSVNDNVTTADLNTITSISNAEGSGKGITSLEGMQYLHNMQVLYLAGNNISDLTPISGLTAISTLFVVSNHISDLTPLSGLTNLASGRFDSQTFTLPQISNNGTLELNLTGVIKNLSGAIPSTINTISNSGTYSPPMITWNGLTTETSLSFRFQQNVIVNGSSIGIFQGTVTQPTQDPAFDPIAAINSIFPDNNLAQIIASKLGKNVTDIVSQADLNTITAISVSEGSNKGISSLTGVEYLRKLGVLYLASNNITDVTPLSGLTQLNTLFLMANHISDISPLASLSNLINFRFDSQTLTSPAVNATNPLRVTEAEIISINGNVLPPETISNGGTYSSPTITWTGLTNQTSVSYTFGEHILIGSNGGEFQGSVTVPLIPDTTPPIITADSDHTYEKNYAVSENQFLLDVGAVTDDGSPITSDFAEVVDLGAVGDYVVTLRSKDSAGNVATPVAVTVHVEDTIAPVITADSEYTYEAGSSINDALFLQDVHAQTDDGSMITSDFAEVVSLEVVGDYTVTLQSTDASGNVATPVTVLVHVIDTIAPVISALPTATYEVDQTVSEATFFKDVTAKTDDGSPVTSDFAEVVDFAVPGSYIVTLESTDENGNVAEPVHVTVIIVSSAVPVISADSDVTYHQFATVSAAQFLKDDHALATNGGIVSSDFASMVNLNLPGDYTVTLRAVNAIGNEAIPVKIAVHVVAANPDEPDKPASHTGAVIPINSQAASSSASNSQRLPDTGDSPIPLAGFGWIIFGVGVLLLKRRK